jgi:ankyrin repeat protein
MKASQTGFPSLSLATTNTYQDFHSHKTDGNKGKNKVSFSLGKHPITGKKLPIIRKGKEILGSKEFNQEFHFIDPINSSAPNIVCRHFSLYALLQRLENNSFKVYEAFKNKETITKTLGKQQKSLENDFATAYRIADAVYILYKSDNDWYDFLNTQFTLLESKQQGNRFFCLLNTPVHTMTLEGLIGRNKYGKLFYRLKFYDPNQTVLTHTVESISKESICKKTIRTFLSEQEQAYKKHKAKITTVAVYYQGNQWQPKAQPVFNTTLTPRHLHSEILFNIMQDGLTEGLKQFLTLAVCLDNRALFDLLNSQDHKDRTALFLAIDTDRSDTITVLTDWLIKRQGLTQAQVFELLRANGVSLHLSQNLVSQNLECTGLQKGLGLGKTESVEVFIAACKQAIAENKISSKQLVTLLKAQVNKSPPPGLYMALSDGHEETVTAFIKGVASIPQINRQVMVELFSAFSSSRTPGLTLALSNDRAQSVTAFMKAVLDIPELDDNDVVELFLAKNKAGVPGVWFAFKSENTQTISAYLKGCIQAFTDGKIHTDQLITLLSAKNGEGEPGLYFASAQGKNKAVFTFIALLIDLLKDKLTLSQLVNLIAAENEQGQLGIEAAKKHPKTLESYQILLDKVCSERSEMAPFQETRSIPHLSQDALITLFKEIQQFCFQLK